MRARTRQRGVTTVEFAIVGGLLLLLAFGIIEFGRVIFTLNVLQESARRGARVAAVCAVNHDGVKKAALFSKLPGLTATNVHVQYFGADEEPTVDYNAIRFVRVSVTGYRHRIYLPLIDRDFPVPTFSSTLPSESLGIAKYGAPAECY